MDRKTYIIIAIIIAIAIVLAFFVFQKPKTVLIENMASDGEPADFSAENKEEIAVESGAPENKNDSASEPVKAAESNIAKEELGSSPEDATKKEIEKSEVSGIKNKIVSFGYQKSSGRKIDTIIIHSSYNSLGGDQYDVDKIIDIYRSYGVAAHYIIGREGKIYKLVEEKNIAYHAGESKVPDGRTGVNNFSIGIELVNSKSDKYTEKQYEALKNLVADIKGRYKIEYTLGHNQIAPGRKDDPWNFEWRKLK